MPVIPLEDVNGKAGAADPLQTFGNAGNVGSIKIPQGAARLIMLVPFCTFINGETLRCGMVSTFHNKPQGDGKGFPAQAVAVNKVNKKNKYSCFKMLLIE